MRKIGLLCLGFVLAITTSCGQGGKKQGTAQPQEQAPQMQDMRRGPGGPGGPGGGMSFNPEDMAKRQVEQIGEVVKFTDGQEAKVTEVMLKYAKKMQEMRGAPGNFMDMSDAQRQEMREKMEAQRAEQNKELKAILSADQFKLYEAYQAEQQKRRMERMQQGGGRP